MECDPSIQGKEGRQMVEKEKEGDEGKMEKGRRGTGRGKKKLKELGKGGG